MGRLVNRVLDIYLKYPIALDIFLIALIWVIDDKVSYITFKFTDKANLISIIGSVIGTCISLAGFILAALTIIVTFRSNLKAKGLEMTENALELIITSGYYNLIVGVYIKAIYEFVLISFLLYISWLCVSNIEDIVILNKIVLSGVIATATTVWRSLWVLFKILRMERLSKQ